MKTMDLRKTSLALLRSLSPRGREVMERRFGLKSAEPETLESIGRDFGVTRERVRQIEYDALKKLREAIQKQGSSFIQKHYKDWLQYLRRHGGIQREDIFLANIGGEHKGHAILLLELSDTFERLAGDDHLHDAWACEKDAVSVAREFVTALAQNLKNLGRTVGDRELLAMGQETALRIQGRTLPPRVVFSYLNLSKDMSKGPHGVWGLREWPEINPRGLRDRAYLVYKKENKPLHFTEVARLIDAHGFNTKGRKVLAQSVHNDLIRDPRFVLIGRGVYALREWGYEAGTVRDVIARVLELAGSPLSAKEVVRRVLQQRQVKTSTILLGLQNKEYFAKTADGKYTLAKMQETTLA